MVKEELITGLGQEVEGLTPMQDELPRVCDRGTKCNAQGYKVSRNGYKLHIDTADCGVPVAAILSSASMHDSQAAIPLSHLTAARVTRLYDVMDAAYCSSNSSSNRGRTRMALS